MNKKSGNYKLAPILFLKAIFTIAVIGAIVALFFFLNKKPKVIRIGAGKIGSESYNYMKSFKNVCDSLYSKELKVELVQTLGSIDNIAKLGQKQIEFATIQSDVKPSENLRLVANLYPDFYQIITTASSNINNIEDLRNKRINISSKGSGQFNSLIELLKHYQINEDECSYVEALSIEATIEQIKTNKIDAIFRVRSPLYKEIRSILDSVNLDTVNNLKFLEIDQGDALAYKIPSTQSSKIPKGIYNVNPPIPSKSLSSMANNRLFICDENISDYTVELVSQALFSNKFYLAIDNPLSNFLNSPINAKGTLIKPHAGAIDFEQRHNPNWFKDNAPLLSFCLSSLMALFALLFGLPKMYSLKMKNLADDKINSLIRLIHEIDSSNSKGELDKIRTDLKVIIEDSSMKLDIDEIDEKGFNSICSLWNTARNNLASKAKEI